MIARKLLPLFDPQKWPHLIHMGYVTELVRRITAWWDVDNPCPEKLEPYRSAVISAAEKEDRDFKMCLCTGLLYDPKEHLVIHHPGE